MVTIFTLYLYHTIREKGHALNFERRLFQFQIFNIMPDTVKLTYRIPSEHAQMLLGQKTVSVTVRADLSTFHEAERIIRERFPNFIITFNHVGMTASVSEAEHNPVKFHPYL